jgi:hypothetical protein
MNLSEALKPGHYARVDMSFAKSLNLQRIEAPGLDGQVALPSLAIDIP